MLNGTQPSEIEQDVTKVTETIFLIDSGSKFVKRYQPKGTN